MNAIEVPLQISMSYRSILLSTLVTVHYENTIDTIDELDASGLPVLMSRGAVYDLVKSDQRPAVRRIFRRSNELSFERRGKKKPEYYSQMY